MLKLNPKIDWKKFGVEEIVVGDKYRWGKICGHGYFSKPFNVEYARRDKCYKTWEKMLFNCFGANSLKEKPTICDEWLDYFEFKKWWDENYYEMGNGTLEMCFTKNFMSFDNNRYSPELCAVIPRFLMTVLKTKRTNIERINKGRNGEEIPSGFTYVDGKMGGKYSAFVQTDVERLYVGMADTLEELIEPYKIIKEDYVHGLAEKNKNIFPKPVYDRLANYEWKIEYNM